ncbi:MAG: NAD(P)/FAD-dependent oxidoreductase [Rhodospirillaceae bacterium]|nr:NAD(P)/FAD-dependent oxidoreductase [Rhodospirillaceae bacterium]
MPEVSSAKRSAVAPDFDVVIVGGGLAGLYSIYRFRKMGLNIRAYEAGDGVGGTWFWNRYPGCRCDVESMEYSYSFDDDLQQEWVWPERYGTQPVILEYINHVAKRFDLMRDVQLNTRITQAVFCEKKHLWTITTNNGEQITAPICIMAAGNLSTPRKPDFPGLDNFKGDWYHTGLWPKEGVDFTDKRVGVIGTGSSGVQMMPHIAAQAKHLTVFQRTANFSLPARNAPLDPEKERKHKEEYRERRLAAYNTPFGIAGYPPPDKSALEATEEERRAIYEDKWQEGGSISYLFAYKDLLLNKDANDTASDFVRNKIRATVNDPNTAELLCPDNHPIGTKRLILDSHYYEIFNQSNVKLVDVKSAPIQEITPNGIKTTESEYQLDAIAFATGFDAMTGAIKEIDVRVDGGTTIEEQWDSGPRTYLGLMVAGLPNMFMITGPQSPGVKSQMILSIEWHINWVANCLSYMRDNNHTRVVAEVEAQQQWVDHVREVADSTLYPLANSWYMGANIPGKARVFMPYVAGVEAYTKECNRVTQNGYQGFEFSTNIS